LTENPPFIGGFFLDAKGLICSPLDRICSFTFLKAILMNSSLIAATALTTILIASGCTSTDPATANALPREEPVYRTGSNIAIRDRAPMTKEEREAQADESRRALQQLQKTGAGNPINN
jgi:hypothetical protein